MQKAKTSAYYQRQYRQRLREQGLTKKEVWILPSRADELLEVERQLREPFSNQPVLTGETRRNSEDMNTAKLWTTAELYEALADAELFRDGRAGIELINGEEPSLHVTMREFGDLPVFLIAMREYILVEALLWPVTSVKNPDKFNMEVMRTRKLFPLSTISIDATAEGGANYIMYGSLSAASSLENVVFEIETLADNVIKATEAFESELNITA